jgi:hypothetical protein
VAVGRAVSEREILTRWCKSPQPPLYRDVSTDIDEADIDEADVDEAAYALA